MKRPSGNRKYAVRDTRYGIPLSNQEYSTLPEAIARWSREVQEAMVLYKCPYHVATPLFDIYDCKLQMRVL